MKCFGSHLFLALALTSSGLLVACGDDVDNPQGGGGSGAGGEGAQTSGGADVGGGGGTGGSGGSGPTTHDVEIDIEVPGWLDAGEALVVLSSVTGEVKQTFRGSDLPAVVSATDGDLVSYLYRSGDMSSNPGTPDEIQYIDSSRIRPAVTHVSSLARPYANHVDCTIATPMQVTVNVPDIPGASAVSVDSPFNPLQFVQNLPGSVVLSVHPCEGIDMFDVMLVARDESGGLVSYERLQDIVFDAGGSISLDASVSDTATSPLQIDVVGADGAAHASGQAIWLGGDPVSIAEGIVTGQSLIEWLEPFSQDWAPPPASFSFAPELFDLAGGHPTASVSVRFQDADAPCVVSDLTRRGASDTPIDFDVTALAIPVQDIDGSWSLGSGGVGHLLRLQARYDAGNIEWSVEDDPLEEPLPVVFPSIEEAQLPAGVVVPPGPFAPILATHVVGEGSYAEVVARPLPTGDFTTQSVIVGGCN